MDRIYQSFCNMPGAGKIQKAERSMNMEMEHLSLANKIFADTRIKMDVGLDTLIRALVEKELGVGSVTLKIKVEMETKVTQDGEVFYEPKFEPKVNIRVAAKGDLDCFVPKGLVMKRTKGGEFLACENQISMEEMLKEQKGA